LLQEKRWDDGVITEEGLWRDWPEGLSKVWSLHKGVCFLKQQESGGADVAIIAEGLWRGCDSWPEGPSRVS